MLFGKGRSSGPPMVPPLRRGDVDSRLRRPLHNSSFPRKRESQNPPSQVSEEWSIAPLALYLRVMQRSPCAGMTGTGAGGEACVQNVAGGAAGRGLEPRLRDSKSRVLPLDDPAVGDRSRRARRAAWGNRGRCSAPGVLDNQGEVSA